LEVSGFSQSLTGDDGSARPAPAVESQLDGLDSEVISSIELFPLNASIVAAEQVAILMIGKVGLSEALMWRARAGQARRVASVLNLKFSGLQIDSKIADSPPFGEVSLSETQSCWQLISNRAMLLPYARGL
jgi:hypothetical protein